MESSLSLAASSLTPALNGNAKAAANQAALNSLQAPASPSDTVNVSFSDLYKSLTVEAKKIIDALNELLKGKLPAGIQSLKPADVTPEATADRIVSTITSSFSSFRKQHADMSDEEVLEHYMELVRGGVEEGYADAFEILEGLGAFDYDGVQSGVEETKKLIDEKLSNFEKTMRQQLGIDAAEEKAVVSTMTDDLLAQGGASTLQIAA